MSTIERLPTVGGILVDAHLEHASGDTHPGCPDRFPALGVCDPEVPTSGMPTQGTHHYLPSVRRRPRRAECDWPAQAAHCCIP